METFKLGCVESCMEDVEVLALWCQHALAFSAYAVDTCYS